MLTGDSWTIHVVQLAVLMWCLLRGVWGTLCFDLLTRSCVRLEKQEWRSWQDHFLPTLHRPGVALALASLSPKASFLPAQLTPLGNHELAEAGGGGAGPL